MFRDKRLVIGISTGLLIIILCAVFLFSNKKAVIDEEIVPTAEISDEDAGKARVLLYYVDKETNKIATEDRFVEMKSLSTDPAKAILSELIKGPIDEKLKSPFPENLALKSVTIEKEIAVIDFSKEFIENGVEDKIHEQMMIDAIVKTLTELTEINGIKILVDSTENSVTKSGIELKQTFLREE